VVKSYVQTLSPKYLVEASRGASSLSSSAAVSSHVALAEEIEATIAAAALASQAAPMLPVVIEKKKR
jgi:hypothetical protein